MKVGFFMTFYYCTKTNVKIKMKDQVSSHYWTLDRSMRRPQGACNFNHLKRICREKGVLFEDPDFTVCNKTIFIKNKPPIRPLIWKRPHEICTNPKFISSSTSSLHIEQGSLGSCWLLAATSCIVSTPKLMDRIVPPDQTFEHNYCGLFRFRFWHFGDWLEVAIDDRLPTHNGKLMYLQSADSNEFWVSLLEKAYAKLYGSYERLSDSSMTEVFQDLTGGIVQSFCLASLDRRLTYRVVNSAVPRATLLVATVQLENKKQLRLRNGLLSHHSFAITGLARVRTTVGEVLLVRLHNPWGRGTWNGSWSDRSWEWESLSDRDKELLSVRGRNENEFWLVIPMCFQDFVSSFSHLDLIHIGPDDWLNEPVLHSKKPWRAVLARRRWRSAYNAGGGPKHIDTVGVNPQFHVHIPRNENDKCHVVMSVMQQYELNISKKKSYLVPIGFAVYEIPSNVPRIRCHFFKETQPMDVTNHSSARETVTFFTLPPGDYVVVPCTENPNTDCRFLLRIFTDEQTNVWEVNDENAIFKYPQLDESFEQHSKHQPNYRIILTKLVHKYPSEIDSQQLLRILRTFWRNYNLLGKPNLEICKSLLMLRDTQICGRIQLEDVAKLLCILYFWQNAFLKLDKSKCSKLSSYYLRPLLWEAGITVSNKVLECLILRFAKDKSISFANFVLAMIRLYLAHDRYRLLRTKLPANPLTPEEVSKLILMTIYA
uniref:Calpain catalytic domain-containing protein n=1 Tax=Strigamia maritima TaxID=126957 RepID=T1JFC5_STRMM